VSFLYRCDRRFARLFPKKSFLSEAPSATLTYRVGLIGLSSKDVPNDCKKEAPRFTSPLLTFERKFDDNHFSNRSQLKIHNSNHHKSGSRLVYSVILPMTPRPLHTSAASDYAVKQERLSVLPLHVDEAESTVSSITNSSFDKYKRNKEPSNESSDICFSPAKTNNHCKRKTDDRSAGLLRHTHESSSHSARPVSNFELAEANSEQKKASDTESSPRQRFNKKQKLLDEEDADDEIAAGMDPATTEGQLALYPTLTLEQAKVAARREYSRRNAAWTRKRNKNMVVVLQEQVSCLTKRIDDLSRYNDVLKTQHDVLRTKNCELLMEQTPRRVSIFASSSSNDLSNKAAAQLLEVLQKQNSNSQQERQHDNSIPQFSSGPEQHGGASNLLPMLQSALLGGSMQLLSALLQDIPAPPPPPFRQAMQSQDRYQTSRASGAQQPQCWQFLAQPLP